VKAASHDDLKWAASCVQETGPDVAQIVPIGGISGKKLVEKTKTLSLPYISMA
jgi:hypothetical protein